MYRNHILKRNNNLSVTVKVRPFVSRVPLQGMQVSLTDSNNISLTSSPEWKLHVPIDAVFLPSRLFSFCFFVFSCRENVKCDPPEGGKSDLLSLSDPAASAVPAVQSDRLQAAGNPQFPERQRGGEQQDEAGQAGAVQRHPGRPLRARGLLQRRLQAARH